MGRKENMRNDLREAMQHLHWATFRINSLLAALLKTLASYQELIREVREITWVCEECGHLYEELEKRWGD